MGTWRVIDALSTLAFDYAPRAEFFRESSSSTCCSRASSTRRVQRARAPTPAPSASRSSCRAATALRGGFRRRWRHQPARERADAIGSVANFLAKHGWKRGERVLLPARVTSDAHRPLLEAGIEPKTTLAELKRYGVERAPSSPLDTPVALIELESRARPPNTASACAISTC
jgi:membrane-bound lytic murein transglycosylase B